MNSQSVKAWLRRPRVVVGGVVAVFVVAAVLTDLPVGSSKADRVSQATAYVKSLQADSRSCRASLGEGFTLERLVFQHKATKSLRSEIPGLLRDDYLACSLTNSAIYDMEANLQAPGFTGGRQLGDVGNALYAWQTLGANRTLLDLEKLLGPPLDQSAAAQLTKDEQQLGAERQQAESSLASAARIIGARLPALDLPQPPAGVPGTGQAG